MVATDVASRGIGMIICCPPPPFPHLSYLYLLPYRRRVIIGALLSLSVQKQMSSYILVQAWCGRQPRKSWTSGAACHDSLLAFHLWLVP